MTAPHFIAPTITASPLAGISPNAVCVVVQPFGPFDFGGAGIQQAWKLALRMKRTRLSSPPSNLPETAMRRLGVDSNHALKTFATIAGAARTAPRNLSAITPPASLQEEASALLFGAVWDFCCERKQGWAGRSSVARGSPRI